MNALVTPPRGRLDETAGCQRCDFAQAYVIAHEIGHHLSHLDGALRKGRDQGAEGGSVRVERRTARGRGFASGNPSDCDTFQTTSS